MNVPRFRPRSVASCAPILALLVSGCGGANQKPGPLPCLVNEPAQPSVQLIYPIPGATNVPVALGVVIYSSYEAVPIVLETGGTTITTTATSVPSPLPSPAATPFPLPSMSPSVSAENYYAVHVGSLAAGTTYTVANTSNETICGPMGANTSLAPHTDGSFTTELPVP